ncbi:MAG: FAD-dependent oxidoreductase [Algoriphagus sp.]|uniref:FAD-dependent oxidoreductase n=1 Tax=Algoriphagus sp. TaxID=1872435 RepID=UPI00261F2E76|nr:FAD-dependent oxidoreductase [Algoriphagus sp.]MDG1276685.1 FAD-dependent oxidoreductase [Algoriphagus sp.]
MKFILSLFLLLYCTVSFSQDYYQADIIIYGGTSAAITAAVQAKKLGKSVIVVSPDQHLGGLSSGGLGFTDTGNKSVIGGLAREFYHRVYLHYQTDSAWKWQKREEYGNKGQGTPAMDGENRTMWIFEPHVAEGIFEDFVAENSILVMRDEWLDRTTGVRKEDGRIKSIKTLSGKVFEGKVFIDATYEGDLMAAAEVSYHVGRESNATYGETWNGVQIGVYQHRHYFKKPVSAYQIPGDPTSGLLPEISSKPPGVNGQGDTRIQAYTFRLAMSKNPANRVPFEKPENYDPARYELLARVYETGWDETFDKFDPIPNLKTDTNNHGPFSTDYIGKNYEYPEASYSEREAIIKDHEIYQKGLLYFLSHDPQVPQKVRDKMAQWGLAKDEFKDNGNWPHQIYVREARRMIGGYVMTEHDVLGDKEVPQPIGMGSYSLDSHNVQRFVTEDGMVQNEGDIGVHPKNPYSISYGTLIPKKSECENLLVPVCVSSSHTAFGSIRMEPVFMILGQSAAAAAVLAIDGGLSVQDISYPKLESILLQENQILSLEY